MPEASAIIGFAAVSLAVAVSPGPTWVYVLTTTLARSRRAGLLAILGNATGILCHVTAAAVGLAAIVFYFTLAFTVLKWIGAAYLLYLAVKIVSGRTQLAPADEPDRAIARGSGRVFRDGVLVNVSNPKVSVLMLALLPQFVRPAQGHVLSQTLLLGSLHAAIASGVLLMLMLSAGQFASLVRRSSRVQSALRWSAAGLLLAFGVRLALAQRP